MGFDDDKKHKGSFVPFCGLTSFAISTHAIFDLGLAEEVFAGVPGDEAELFELVVGALDFAFVDGEFLGERDG